MKRMLSVLVCAFMLGGFAGCSGTEGSEPVGEASVSTGESTFDATLLEKSSQQEASLTEMDGDTSLPDFLDENQQQLYLRAKMIFPVFSGDSTNIDRLFDGSQDWESVEINGERYLISNGCYRQWEDFMAMMRSLFTEEYIAELAGTGSSAPSFLEYDGRLCYREMARGSVPGYQEPDGYKLTRKTDEEIAFDLIGHYIPLGGGEAYTESYPIRMVLTEDGWRFAEFLLAW